MQVNLSYLYLHLHFLRMWCFFPAQLSGARYVVRFIFATHEHSHTHSPHPKCAQLLDATVCSELRYLFSDEPERKTRRTTKKKKTKRANLLSSLALSCPAWLCSFTTGLQPNYEMHERNFCALFLLSPQRARMLIGREKKVASTASTCLSLSLYLSLSSIALYLSDELAKETSDTRRSNEVCLGGRRHHGRSHCATEEDLISLSQPLQETRPTASRPPDKPRVPALRIS